MTAIKKHTDKLIKKANLITGLDTLYLLKGGAWLTLSQISITLIALMFVLILTRTADKVFFGKYQLILSIIATLTIFGIPGINNALMRAVSLGKEHSFITTLKERLLTSLVGSLALFCTAGYFHFQGDSQLSLVFAVLGLIFPTIQITPLISSYFYAKKKFLKPSIISILEKAVPVLAGLAVLATKNITVFAISYFISIAVLNIIVLVWFFATEKLNNKSEEGLFKYGIKLSIANAIPKFSQQIDKQAMAFFLGLPQLAIYSISLLIPDTIDGFSGLFQNLIISKIVHTKSKDIASKLIKPWFVIGSILGVVAIALCIPIALKLAFPAYADSIFLSQMYSLILPAVFIWKTTNNWMITTKKLKAYTILINSFYLSNGLLIALFLFMWQSALAVVIARVVVTYVFALIALIFMRTQKETKQAIA